VPVFFSEAEAKPNRGIVGAAIEVAVRQSAIDLREHDPGVGIELLGKLPIDDERNGVERSVAGRRCYRDSAVGRCTVGWLVVMIISARNIQLSRGQSSCLRDTNTFDTRPPSNPGAVFANQHDAGIIGERSGDNLRQHRRQRVAGQRYRHCVLDVAADRVERKRAAGQIGNVAANLELVRTGRAVVLTVAAELPERTLNWPMSTWYLTARRTRKTRYVSDRAMRSQGSRTRVAGSC
jgi:hypothetical protein